MEKLLILFRTNTAKKLIPLIFLSFFMLRSYGQITPVTETDPQEDFPQLRDWFLSTGDWHNDPQLYVREVGTGSDIIIMIHGGWGGEHSGLIETVKGLENQYRFIFYDQRGSLRSPCPDSLISFDHHIEDLELLRKELKLDKLSLVGHSMGAVLASAYASKYPTHIEQLTLLAPAFLKNPTPEEDLELQKQEEQAFQDFLERPEVSQELEKYGLNGKNSVLSSKEETALFRINFGKRMLYDIQNWPLLMGGRAIYQGHVFSLTAQSYPKEGWDYVQDFSDGRYPVSIIVGDHDFLNFGTQTLQKWVKGIPNISLKIIRNAGHIIWLDQPETFAKEFKQHLLRKN